MKKIFLSFIVLFAATTMFAQTDSTLQQYTGKYKFPDGSPVTEIIMTIENGVLMGSSSQGTSEFKKVEGDVFEIVAFAGTATFRRTEGKVSGMQVVVGDLNMEGTKTELGIRLNNLFLASIEHAAFIPR